MSQEISRRKFLSGAAGASLAALAFSTGCSRDDDMPPEEEEDTSIEEDEVEASTNTFEGVSPSIKGDVRIVVKMTQDKKAIQDVSVVEKHDSPFISDTAADVMCERIVEQQSVDVDTVSGATITSMAILVATRAALDEAQADKNLFSKHEDAELEQANDVSCDVLVIGGGAAGLSAAISAKTDAQLSARSDSELNVILVEKLGYTGGCIRVSDAILWAPNNTRYNQAVQQSTSDDELVNFTKEHPLFENYLNEGLWRKVLANIPTTFNGLLDRGLYMPVNDALPGLIAPDLPGPYWQVRNPITGEAPFFKAYSGFNHSTNMGAQHLAQSLYYLAIDAGVEILTSTEVKNLSIENKKVTGVEVVDTAHKRTYNIHAKQVILATGCLGADIERVYELEPETKGALHFGCAGTTGDGIDWIKDNGGEVLKGSIHYVIGPDEKLGHYDEYGKVNENAPRITVNLDGERFYNEGITSEYAHHNPDDPEVQKLSHPTGIIQQQENNMAFAIISGDAAEVFEDELEFLIDRGVAWKANTLEELATLTEINSSNLIKTINDYNAAYASGNDYEFGIKNEMMTPVSASGPYYAMLMRSLINLVDYGVRVDENLSPVTKEGTTIFENLHTAGSIMVSNYSFMWGGISHATAMSSGVIAGNIARDSIKNGTNLEQVELGEDENSTESQDIETDN